MQNNKHYYLINGTVKVSDSKMPVGEDYVSIKPTFFNKTWFESDTKEWLSSLQPCEIDESELEKIKNKVYTFDNCKADNPIDITDIVGFERVETIKNDEVTFSNKLVFKQSTEKQVEEATNNEKELSIRIMKYIEKTHHSDITPESLTKVFLDNYKPKQVESDAVDEMFNDFNMEYYSKLIYEGEQNQYTAFAKWFKNQNKYEIFKNR